MFSVAYVIIPQRFGSLQEELDRALAAFRRGGANDFPAERLAFDDVTPDLRRLHGEPIEVIAQQGGGIAVRRSEPGALFAIDLEPMRAMMRERSLTEWRGSLDQLEPDFAAFAERFSRYRERDPATGGWGQWINPLGRWDWWDLGGCFDGWISDQRPDEPHSGSHMISSGPSRGCDLVGRTGSLLGAEAADVEAEIAANVEPVSALLAAAHLGAEHAVPGALVLPAGSCTDELRWLDGSGWRLIPAGVASFLGRPPEADFRDLVLAAYERFDDHGAAGVAYHL